jgi:hypothetical protein
MKKIHYNNRLAKRMLILLAVSTLFVCCTRAVYVPQETVRTEYRDRVKYDSIYEHDSVFVRVAADTVLMYRDRWRDRYHMLRDTIVVRDSISYPVVVEVEKQVRYVPKLYKYSMWIAIATLVVCASWVIKKLKPL